MPIAEAMIANSYVRHSNLCWDYTIQQLARLMNWPPLFLAWYPPHSCLKWLFLASESLFFIFPFFLRTHTTYSGIHWLLVTTQENERKVRKSPRKSSFSDTHTHTHIHTHARTHARSTTLSHTVLTGAGPGPWNPLNCENVLLETICMYMYSVTKLETPPPPPWRDLWTPPPPPPPVERSLDPPPPPVERSLDPPPPPCGEISGPPPLPLWRDLWTPPPPPSTQ